MVTPKQKGTRWEYNVAYLFERFGYSWDRSGSSLGIDLKIWKDGRLRYLVSAKKTSTLGPIYLPRREVERLKISANETGAGGLICFGFRRTPILVITLDEIHRLENTRLSYKLHPTDGRPLIELLTEARA